MHREVEKWLFDKLGQIGIEADTVTEMKALRELYASYHEHDDKMDEFFRKGIKGYLSEIKSFYARNGVDWDGYDADYLLGVAWSCLDNNFMGHDELRQKLHEMDRAKVEAAKKFLAKKKDEHRKAVKAVMLANDDMTQKVMCEEVAKLVHETKELEMETVPWMERYEEMKVELQEFRSRLQSLLKTIEESDIDGKAQRIMGMVSRITLYFQKKPKYQGRTVNPNLSSICFNASFVPNDPSS